MNQVDLKKVAYFFFFNKIKASFFKRSVYGMTYTLKLFMSFECHVSSPCLIQTNDCTQDALYGDTITTT